MAKYEVVVKKYGEIKNSLVIPRFQRSPIWSDSKKIGFIESIKKGLPIGCILVSKNKNDTFDLVDGLQRISTLRDVESNRFKYVSVEEIRDCDIYDIIDSDHDLASYTRMLLDQHNYDLLGEIRNTICKGINFASDDDLNEISWGVVNELKQIAILAKYHDKLLHKTVYAIVKRVDELLEVNEVLVPLIVYKSDGSSNGDLIEIFTKLNTEGVILSKYDIYSAKWQDVVIKLDINKGESLINTVIKKYEISEEKSGLQVSGFDPSELRQTGEINIFEYAYAISKVLSNESDFLFESKNETSIDSFGFTILAGIFNIHNKNMENLGSVLSKLKIDYVELLNSIAKCIEALEKSLSKWLMYDGKKFHVCHSEMQLASYVILLHKLTYTVTDTKIINNSKKIERTNFLSFLHKHYLYDMIRGYWAGSGDSKLDEIVLNPLNNRYLLDVDRNSFEIQLANWLDEQNKKINISVSKEAKVYLNYIFAGKKMNLNNNSVLEIDHIVTKYYLKKYFKDKGISIPISTPCNLVIIPSFENRSKRELTFYQLQRKREDIIKISTQELEHYAYPLKEELSFTESDSTFTQDNYLKFLNNRKIFLVNRTLEILFG